MPESDYQQQYGMTLHFGDPGALVTLITTDLAGVKEFGELPGGEVADIDITRVDQTGPHKKFAAEKLIDPGQITLTLGVKVSMIATVQGLVGVSKSFLVTFADASKVHFEGYIKSYKPKAQKGDEATCEITIKVSGAPTWVAAV